MAEIYTNTRGQQRDILNALVLPRDGVDFCNPPLGYLFSPTLAEAYNTRFQWHTLHMGSQQTFQAIIESGHKIHKVKTMQTTL